MTIAIISSLPIIIVPSVISIKAIDALESNTDFQTALNEFYPLYIDTLKSYGIISGGYYIILSLCLLMMFKELFALINNGHKLSEPL